MKVELDFFELSFLAEACIPPAPIARSMLWTRFVDEFYHMFTPEERVRLRESLSKSSRYDLNNENVAVFDARYNPDNQYELELDYLGQNSKQKAFKYKERYHVYENTSIMEKFIVSVKKV